MKQGRNKNRLVVLLLLIASIVQGGSLPNVVMIMADDLGWSDIAAYRRYQVNVMGHDLSALGGTDPIPTPNLDRLCNEGMMFTDAHTAAGLCAPTRFSMMTGSNPYRNGRETGTWAIHATSAFTADGRYHKTVGEVAQAAGYRTAFLGKMHLGGGTLDGDELSLNYEATMPDFPTQHGFDYTFNVHDGIQADPYLYLENDRFVKIDPSDPFNPAVPGVLADTTTWVSGVYANPNGYSVIQAGEEFHGIGDVHWDSSQNGIINSRKAAAFIGNHLATYPNQPFMMYYCPPQVHLPHTPPIDFDPNPDGTPHDPPNIPVMDAFAYGNEHAKVIHELDLQVGVILDKLEDPNGDGDKSDSILTNTLVMVTSDNGGLSTNKINDGANKTSSNDTYDSTGALRGTKGNSWEGGHRVPFIAVWSGTIVPGSVSEQLIAAHDWVGLMYGLTHTDMGPTDAMDAANILPILLGQQSESEPLREFMIHQGNPSVDTQNPYILRQGDYVLLLAKGNPRYGAELYNLATDLMQTSNLINDPAQQTRIAEMETLYHQYNGRLEPRSTPAYTYIPSGPDTDPPAPNPAGFASAPVALGPSSISMTAETGSDPAGPVQYLFTETSGHEGGSDSGWQVAPTYVDDKLLPGLTYSYTVQMRDVSNNVGMASASFDAATFSPGSSNSTVMTENFGVAPTNMVLTTSSTPLNNSDMLGGVAENTWMIASTVVMPTPANALSVSSSKDKMRAATYTITADRFPGADPNATLSFDVLDIWNNGFLEVVVAGINNPGVSGDAVIYDVLGGSTETYGSGIGLFPNGATASVTTLGSLVIGGLADNDVASVVTNHAITFNYNGTDDVVLFFGAAANAGLTADKQATIDNISLVSSSGTAVTMFEQWQINYDVSGATNDADGDGLSNLGEFARGGNPTDPESIGHLPSVVPNDVDLVYVYPRRKDSGLNYWLETSTNLISSAWTNSGYTELPGVGAIDADFEAVTNEISISDSQGFIRLRVE